jgi:hypothetical protein
LISRRSLLSGLAALVAACSIAAGQAGATTAPEQTFFIHVNLTNSKIVLPIPHVQVGTLVVFVVKNTSSHARNITVGTYKSRVLQPGRQLQFELSFPVPWAFDIRSTGKNVPTLTAKFVCSF